MSSDKKNLGKKSPDEPDKKSSTPVSPTGIERRTVKDFESYYNKQFDAKPLYIKPGGILCGASEQEMFVANVGSGVLVTLHDTELKIGGMAYVLLPPELLRSFPYFDNAEAAWRVQAVRPIEECIGEMKRKGAGKHRIQMRLIGGGRMPGETIPDAGTKNYIFVREYITRKGLSLLNEDLGGVYVRRVHFFPHNGRAVRMMLRRTSDFDAVQAVENKE